MKLKYFICFIIFVSNNICCGKSNNCQAYTNHCSTNCQIFNDPICIVSPCNEEIFLTNFCLSNCKLCECINGVPCNLRVLNTLIVRGTTAVPYQSIVVIVTNSFISGIKSLSQSTISTRGPGGNGIWSVTFKNIPPPKLINSSLLNEIGNIFLFRPIGNQGLPTIITATTTASYNKIAQAKPGSAMISIFIKKDIFCKNDCDVVCPQGLG